MTSVIKMDKSVQTFKASKIAKACVGSGVPKPVADTIAKMVAKEIKGKKTIKTTEIREMVFKIFDAIIAAKEHWINYKKKE